MTDTDKLEIALKALAEIGEIAVAPGCDPMKAVIEAQRIAQAARLKIAGIKPDEPPPRSGLRLVKK